MAQIKIQPKLIKKRVSQNSVALISRGFLEDVISKEEPLSVVIKGQVLKTNRLGLQCLTLCDFRGLISRVGAKCPTHKSA